MLAAQVWNSSSPKMLFSILLLVLMTSRGTRLPSNPSQEHEEILSRSLLSDQAWEKRKELSKKSRTHLQRIESGLARARLAIKEASFENKTVDDPDYVPNGPIYLNPQAFHRSYLEMEKLFKVYIYEDGEPPVFHYGLSKGVLGLEGIFIHQMEINDQFQTRDPNRAHVYFLPFSVISLTHFVLDIVSPSWNGMKDTIKDYVSLISGSYPYWNRSLGADHFMLACHDWGPEISFSVPNLYNNSIRALCNANTSERFVPSRDVSIPEIFLPEGTMDGSIGGPPPSNRSILVFYAGGIHGSIREILLQHWKDKDPEVRVTEYLPGSVNYYDMIRQSKFCICPSGWEVASPRMVEGIYMGCVPVLIKDSYAKPFADVLDWKEFAVEIPVAKIPSLKEILLGISDQEYLKLQEMDSK